jgi:hypothetical protein
LSLTVDGPSTTDVYSFGLSDFSESGSGPYTYTLSTTQAYNDGSGTYTATIDAAVDPAGNDGASGQSDTYTFDPAAPAISTVSLGNDGSGNLAFSFESDEQLGGSASDVAVTVDGPTSGTDVYSFDRSDFSESGSGPYTYTLQTTQSFDDGSGTYTATVDVAKDANGNDGANGESDSYTLDTSAPTLSNVSLENDGNDNLAFSFESDEALGTNASDLAVRVDGPSTAAVYSFDRTDFTESGSGPYTYTLSTTQAYDDGDGTYTAAVEDALDPSGNDGADGSQSDTYTLDTTAPTISGVTLGNDGSDNLAFSFDTSEPIGGSGSDLAVSVDGPSTTNVYTFGRSDFSETDNGDGTYTYTLQATQAYDDGSGTYTAAVDDAVDPAGNDGADGSQTDSYSFDPNAPALSSVTLADDGAGNLALSFESNEPLDSIAVSVDGPSTADVYRFDQSDFDERGSGPYTYTLSTTQPYDDGTGPYTATIDAALDADGNDGGGVSDTYTFETAAPTIASIADTTIAEDQSTGPRPFTVSGGTTAASDLIVSASSDTPTLVPNDSLTLGGSGTTRTITATPRADSNGTAVISVTVEDSTGRQDSTAFELTVEPVNDAPVARADSASVLTGSTVTVPVLANDTDIEGALDSSSVTVERPPANGSVSAGTDGEITYEPDPGYSGPDSLTYTVADASGARSAPAPVRIAVQAAALAVTGDPLRGVAQVGRSADTAAVTLKNVGNVPLTNLQARITGAAAGDFSVARLPGDSLAPSDSGIVRVAFTPTDTGLREAELSIRTAEGAEAPLRLVGHGVSIGLSPGDAARGQVGVRIDGTVRGGFVPTERTALYVRTGGTTRYRAVDSFRVATATDTTVQLRGRVPDTLTTRGLDYYAVLSDGRDTLTVPAGGTGRAAAQPRHLPVTFDQWRAPFALTPKSYRMVSVPARPDDGVKAALEAAYGSYDPDTWRAFRWAPSDQTYREYGELGPLQPGEAFWLITATGSPLALNEGQTVDASEPQRIPLEPRWNQVGSPFDFGVSWDRIVAASDLEGADLDGPVAFRGNSYQPRRVSVLKKWRGYFVFNATGQRDTLVVPPVAADEAQQQAAREPAARASDPKDAPAAYTLRVTVQTPDSPSQQVWIGFRAEAKRGRDALDFAQPPPVEAPVRLSVPEPVAGRPVPHAGSFKPPSDAGQTWTMTLSHSASAGSATQVRLQLDATGRLPADQRRYVLDLDANRRLTPGQAIELAPGEQRRLRVILGTEAYAKQKNAGVPLTNYETALRGNAPNPFDEETTLTYTLGSEREVTVALYDVLGRRVRTLVDGETREAGLHRTRWRGENPYGEPVGSGVYFVRMEAGDFTATQKVVLVR